MTRMIDLRKNKEDETAREDNESKRPGGWHRPAQFSGVHGVGRHRPALDMAGGVPTSKLLAQATRRQRGKTARSEDFSFVQISDSHIGFNKGANPDVTGTLKKAIDKINIVPAGMKRRTS